MSTDHLEEDVDSEDLFEIDIHRVPLEIIKEEGESSQSTASDPGEDNDVVYVAVKVGSQSSMKALRWTLDHAVTPFTQVYLLHVFPEVKLIPTPEKSPVIILNNNLVLVNLCGEVGKLPRSHIGPHYVNEYLARKKGEKKLLLRKFMTLCNIYHIKEQILLIEGDNVVNAISNLVRELNIRKLVVGISKSNISKVGAGGGNGITELIVKRVPEICDVKVVCEGKEIIDQMMNSLSTSTSPSPSPSQLSPKGKENDATLQPKRDTDEAKAVTPGLMPIGAKYLKVLIPKFLFLT